MFDDKPFMRHEVQQDSLIPIYVDCPYCGLKEDLSRNSPLVRLEVIEHHKRGMCKKKWY